MQCCLNFLPASTVWKRDVHERFAQLWLEWSRGCSSTISWCPTAPPPGQRPLVPGTRLRAHGLGGFVHTALSLSQTHARCANRVLRSCCSSAARLLRSQLRPRACAAQDGWRGCRTAGTSLNASTLQKQIMINYLLCTRWEGCAMIISPPKVFCFPWWSNDRSQLSDKSRAQQRDGPVTGIVTISLKPAKRMGIV